MSPVTACIVVSNVFIGAAVIGAQDTPGLEVRDDTFDEIADMIDGRVVSFIGVGEFTDGWVSGQG